MALRNKREKESPNLFPLDRVDFSDTTMSHSKLKVMCVITMLLQKQHAEIVQYKSCLPQWPENTKQFHAERYRRGQLHILRAVNATLLDHLASLVGLKTPDLRDVRVVRLKHTLLESPQPLQADYRAVLNAGLGTRNAEKIKKRGYAQCAFALWVCGWWLLSTSADVSSADGQEFHLPAGLLQWLRRDDVYKIMPCIKGTVDDQQPNGKSPDSASDAGSVEDVVSLRNMIRAAVIKHPKSLYNNPAVTQDRLLWCLHIVQEESAMAPNLEGEVGDANDELLLFLEYHRSDGVIEGLDPSTPTIQ